jgi:hypothetical protein
MMDPVAPDADPVAPNADPAAPAASPEREGPVAAPPRPRPMIERIGMAFIAVILAALFAVVALAAFAGGEPFLGVMAAIGCLMVLWVGGLTLFKGR